MIPRPMEGTTVKLTNQMNLPRLLLVTIIVLGAKQAEAATAVLQYHNDQHSTGQNLHETALTYATVNARQFAKQFATPVDAQVFAQPLYMPALATTGGAQPGMHDVVFIATEQNSLYAIDAAGGNVLWQTSFIDTKNARVNILGAQA